MNWWLVISAILAAPVLILALALWGLYAAFGKIFAVVVPRPETSEWDEMPMSLFIRRTLPGMPRSGTKLLPRKTRVPEASSERRFMLN